MAKYLGFALPRFYKQNLWAQIALGLVLSVELVLIGALLMPIYDWGSPLGYIALLIGAWLLSLLFHECGHAIVGYLVGAPAQLIVLVSVRKKVESSESFMIPFCSNDSHTEGGHVDSRQSGSI